ncbi:MAG: sugar transporter permease [Paenibacillaceae bacterium]|jgi:putative aldouronate transport system permease protein|nr:sugar transporter permease [Paenibacillaceae bacterium]
MKPTNGDKIFYTANYIFLTLVSLAALYPFLYVLSASFSAPEAVVTGKVVLFPVDVNISAYVQVMRESSLWLAYANTVFYTVLGTAASMLLTVLGAYPLSKSRLAGGAIFSFIISLTLWINMSGSAGMIPFYLNLRDMNMLDSRFAIIIAFAVGTFNVILMKSFFGNIPEAMEESAKIDGANDFQILWKIYLPLSVPSLVTVGLFYAVARWNSYFWSMILLKDPHKLPLQVLLKKLIVEMNVEQMMDTVDVVVSYSKETLIYATIIVSVIPIVLVYPFIQSYFVKGMILGAVKE